MISSFKLCPITKGDCDNYCLWKINGTCAVIETFHKTKSMQQKINDLETKILKLGNN